MRERNRRGWVEWSVTVRAHVERGREAKVSDNFPRACEPRIECSVRRRSRYSVEAFFDCIENPRDSFLIRKPQHDLRNHRRGGKSPDVFAELGTCARYIERTEGLKLSIGTNVYLCNSLREQIHRPPESFSRIPRASRKNPLHSRIPGEQTKYARRLQVIERV